MSNSPQVPTYRRSRYLRYSLWFSAGFFFSQLSPYRRRPGRRASFRRREPSRKRAGARMESVCGLNSFPGHVLVRYKDEVTAKRQQKVT